MVETSHAESLSVKVQEMNKERMNLMFLNEVKEKVSEHQ